MSFKKKITMSDFWNAKTEGPKLTTQKVICNIIGNATGVKTGESQYGTFTALTGMFEAKNPETGEVLKATTLFVPDVILGFAVPDAGESRKFAVRVVVGPDLKSPVGYSYGFDPLIEAHDPLQDLRNQLLQLEDKSSKGTKAA